MKQFDLGRLGMFGITWLTFSLAAIGAYLFVIYRTQGAVRLKDLFVHAFPPTGWLTKSAGVDVMMYVISKFSGGLFSGFQLVVLVVASGAVSGVMRHMGAPSAHHDLSLFAIAGWSLLAFLVRDFANYLTHFLQHFVPVLWEFHKVHHSATFLTPLTTKRTHPFGDEFDGIIATMLSAIPFGIGQHFLGLNSIEMTILTVNANLIGTILVLDALRHSHFQVSFGRFDRILISPQMHQFHHSALLEHWDVNFGNKLSIWDWAFGTGYKPTRGEHLKLGLGTAEELEYNSLYGAYIRPFGKIARLITGQPSFVDPAKPPTHGLSFFARVLWRSPSYGLRRQRAGDKPPAEDSAVS